jgi:hypothetical protein
MNLVAKEASRKGRKGREEMNQIDYPRSLKLRRGGRLRGGRRGRLNGPNDVSRKDAKTQRNSGKYDHKRRRKAALRYCTNSLSGRDNLRIVQQFTASSMACPRRALASLRETRAVRRFGRKDNFFRLEETNSRRMSSSGACLLMNNLQMQGSREFQRSMNEPLSLKQRP